MYKLLIESEFRFSDLTRSFSAAEIMAETLALTKTLKANSVSRVALLADNSIEWAVADIACCESRICLLPLPAFFSDTQRRHAIHAGGIQAVITDNPSMFSADDESICKPLTLFGETSLSLCWFKKNSNSPALPDNTGKITFTSGSTGEPKGVCLSHQQLIRQAGILSSLIDIKAPRHLCLLPLSTLLENVAGIYAPILSHGEVIIPKQGDLGFEGSSLVDPQKLLAAIRKVQPDSVILIPQLLLLLVNGIKQGWQCPLSLKFVAVGGSKVAKDLLTEARSLGIPVYEGYGLSECASVVSLNTPCTEKVGSCGMPLSGSRVSVSESEVVVSGNTMLGYINEPSSWNQSEIHTGDLGHLDQEGFLHIGGRKKNLLISSYGRNISPEWVESEILANPLLLEAVLVGDSKPYCAALLSPSSSDVSDSDIQAHIDQVNSSLPDYARVIRWHRLPRLLHGQSEFMTDNGRPRRDSINRAFMAEIDALYTCGFSDLMTEVPNKRTAR